MSPHYFEMFESWLKLRLSSGILHVTFTKADGTQRVMKCTRDPRLLPPLEYAEPASGIRKKKSGLLSVWDIDKAAWRTLTYDRIRTIECETELKPGDLPWEKRS